MSGHEWWPDKDKSSWRMWHSPTYEDKRDSKEYWHKSWTKTWDWGSPTGAVPKKKLSFESPDKDSGRSSSSHRKGQPDRGTRAQVFQWPPPTFQMNLTATTNSSTRTHAAERTSRGMLPQDHGPSNMVLWAEMSQTFESPSCVTSESRMCH